MSRFAVAAMGVALAAPVAAQDVASDFSNAFTQAYGSGAAEPASARLRGLSIIADLEGNWIDAGQVMNGAAYDAALAEQSCSFIYRVIATDGAFRFTLETSRRGELQGDQTEFVFNSGSYFTYVTDLDGVALRLFQTDDPLSLDPGLLESTIVAPGMSGVARVELVGPDVVLIDSPTAAPMVLTRCP